MKAKTIMEFKDFKDLILFIDGTFHFYKYDKKKATLTKE